MADPPSPQSESPPPRRDLYPVLDELDRLEELLEGMTELGVDTRADVERRLAELNREVDEFPDG
jgi:hypothetical protein